MAAVTNTIFSPETAARFDKLATIYPMKRSALVPMLLYSQDEVGYVSDEVVAELAVRLDLLEVDVRSVLSYYSMLRTAPVGKYNVQVCTNISCMLRGGFELLDHCKHTLGIGHKQTTADGLFSLEEVECIGACCWAPAVQVNYDFHDNLTPAKMDAVLTEYRERRTEDVEVEHLTEGMLQARLDVDAGGAGLEQFSVLAGDHQLIPQRRGQLTEPNQGHREHDQSDDTGDLVLVLPGPRARTRHEGRDDQRPENGPERPEAHGRGTAELRREITHQRGRRHENDALDETDQHVDQAEAELGVGVGECEQAQQADDPQSDGDDVRPPIAVSQSSRPSGQGPHEVTDHADVHVVGERHVQLTQDRRGDSAAEVQLVVEDDRRRDDDAQADVPGCVGRVADQRPVPQSVQPVRCAGGGCVSSAHALTSLDWARRVTARQRPRSVDPACILISSFRTTSPVRRRRPIPLSRDGMLHIRIL